MWQWARLHFEMRRSVASDKVTFEHWLEEGGERVLRADLSSGEKRILGQGQAGQML